jgi:inward rectifier potassium channel
MNWTVVHPINEESPLWNFTQEEMRSADLELYVQVTGFDHIFSNVVMQRTSYTFEEIVWDAKFDPMYQESSENATTIIQLNKLNDYKRVSLPKKSFKL